MSTHVPLISSGTTGPLGVYHLPRLWQKVSLEARGKLAAGYPGIGKGYGLLSVTNFFTASAFRPSAPMTIES